MNGTTTAFYYIDYDEDAPGQGFPAFGLFDSAGNPTLDLDCSTWKPDMRIRDYPNLPAYMGES